MEFKHRDNKNKSKKMNYPFGKRNVGVDNSTGTNSTVPESKQTSVSSLEPVNNPLNVENKDENFPSAKDVTIINATGSIHALPTSKVKLLKEMPLSILMIENSVEVVCAKEMVFKIINTIIPLGLTCIINYCSKVRVSNIFDKTTFDWNTIICPDDIGTNICLLDAFVEMNNVALTNLKHIVETNTERIKISNIDIIGIGTCREHGSIHNIDFALMCLDSLADVPEITTKYYALTDEFFTRAAEIGFRSIGAIYRTF